MRAGRLKGLCQVTIIGGVIKYGDTSSGIISPVATEEVKNKHKAAIAEYFHCNKRRHHMYGARQVELFVTHFRKNIL